MSDYHAEYISQGPGGFARGQRGAAIPPRHKSLRAIRVFSVEGAIQGLSLTVADERGGRQVLSLGSTQGNGLRLGLSEGVKIDAVFGGCHMANQCIANLGLVLSNGKVHFWNNGKLEEISAAFGTRWPHDGFRFMVPAPYQFRGFQGRFEGDCLTSIGMVLWNPLGQPNMFVFGRDEDLWQIFPTDIRGKDRYRVCFRDTVHGTIAMLIQKNGQMMPLRKPNQLDQGDVSEANCPDPLPIPQDPIPDHLLRCYFTQEFFYHPLEKRLTNLTRARQISLWESAKPMLHGAYNGKGQAPPWQLGDEKTGGDSGSWGAEEEGG